MYFRDKFYPTVLQHSLEEFRSNNMLCDVKLLVGGQEFQAHKLILSAASPYFRFSPSPVFPSYIICWHPEAYLWRTTEDAAADIKLVKRLGKNLQRIMFNEESSFIESKQEKVALHGIDANAFSDILKFMYSSDIEINDSNVYVLMEAANLLQFYALKTFITFYLRNSMKIDNCLRLYIMASLHCYHDLAANAFHFLLTNFSKIMEGDEFLEIPVETLLEILSSKLIDVASEETLYEIIRKWIQKDPDLRMKHLDSLSSKLNLNLFSIDELMKIKENGPVTTEFQLMIEEVIKYKSLTTSLKHLTDSEDRCNFHKFRHRFEKFVIFAIGGESSGMASQSVECFTLGYDKWRYLVPEYIIKRHETKYTSVLPPLRCARYYAASTYDAYNVYVIGGRNSTALLDECEVFHIKTNQWNNFHHLPEKLFAGGAALLEGELLVAGGFNEEDVSRKVWKWDKVHKIWTSMPPLDFARYFHGTIALGGYLYVLGGYDGEKQEALQTCSRFDPGSNKWFQISPMHRPRAKFGCAAVDNYIYVFGGTSDGNHCLKSVERYNALTDEWSYESSMTVARHSFSVAVTDHEIYCLGGTDGTHFLDTVEKFSLRTKRWHCVHSMQISRLAPAGAALVVPYSPSEVN